MSAPMTTDCNHDAARAHGSSLRRLVMRQFDGVTLYNADCRNVLPLKADAMVTDPPYGIGADTHAGGSTVTRNGKKILNWKQHPKGDRWDVTPADDETLAICISCAPICVVWGGNHFALPPSRGWLVWNKGQRDFSLGDCELAWSNRAGVVRCKDISRKASSLEAIHHPTQKPVALMAWCLEVSRVPVGATVLDPFMGSGSTAIACIRTGRKFIGVEKDTRHFETACERIRCELAQGVLLPHNSD